MAKMVSGRCFLYGILLHERNHIELEDLGSPHKLIVTVRTGDSQRIVQHVKQCVNICPSIRNRDHRHVFILFAPPDTDVILQLESFCKDNRVFGKDGFVASEQVEFVFGGAGGLEDDVPVREPNRVFDDFWDDLEVSIHVCL